MVDDRTAIAELASISKPGALHILRHYLYLPREVAAASIAAELQHRGFHTEQRLGADGVNWLVLAWHEVIPTDDLVLSTRKMMEDLVRPSGGEYDGWEAEVR